MNNSGRTTDAKFWKTMYSSDSITSGSYYGGSSGYGNSYYDSDWTTRKTKREHKFSPILLVFTTVYNCEHCKRKKEDCKYTYCEDEDNPPELYDTGGW